MPSPAARGLGVAASLLGDAKEHAREAGAALMRLETRLDNHAAQRMFRQAQAPAQGHQPVPQPRLPEPGLLLPAAAEARGDRITPSVDTILDLQHRRTQQASLERLDRLIAGLDDVPRSVNTLSFHVAFGHIEDPALAELARKAFELFRCRCWKSNSNAPTAGMAKTAGRPRR